MVVLAPMPRASAITATIAKSGLFLNMRTLYRRSCSKVSIYDLHICEDRGWRIEDRQVSVVDLRSSILNPRFSFLRRAEVSLFVHIEARSSGPVELFSIGEVLFMSEPEAPTHASSAASSHTDT